MWLENTAYIIYWIGEKLVVAGECAKGRRKCTADQQDVWNGRNGLSRCTHGLINITNAATRRLSCLNPMAAPCSSTL